MKELGIPPPPEVISLLDPALVLGFFIVLAASAFVAAIVIGIRRRDALPVVLCIGAMICSLNEPFYDVLGKLTYSQNSILAFTAMGRNIPWFLVLSYVPFVGILPYLIMLMMSAGVPRARLHLLALGVVILVSTIETISNSQHGWLYYGESPLKYLVVAPQLGPLPMVQAFLLFAIAEPLGGWRRLLAGLAISTLALPMVFASVTWPVYFGLQADLPAAVDWLLCALMLSFCAATVVAATGLAERLRIAGQTKTVC